MNARNTLSLLCLTALAVTAKAQTQAAPSSLDQIFNESSPLETLQNGQIRHGSIRAAEGTAYPAIVIDRPNNPETLLLVTKLNFHTQSFDDARATCRALGDGWDLPPYETRFQIVASTKFAVKGATLTDQYGRVNDIYAMWLRNREEKQNVTLMNGKDIAVAISMPHDKRHAIAERVLEELNYNGSLRHVWIDGQLWMRQSNQENETVLQYNDQLQSGKLASTAKILEYYFSNTAELPADLRANIDEFFQKNIPLKSRAQAAARGGFPALKAFAEREMVNNYEHIYAESARFRNQEVRSQLALKPVLQKFYSDPKSMALYCTREFDRAGKAVSGNAPKASSGSQLSSTIDSTLGKVGDMLTSDQMVHCEIERGVWEKRKGRCPRREFGER